MKLSGKIRSFAAGIMALSASIALVAPVAASAETLLKVERLDGTIVEFDREDLEALDQVEFTTSTPWTEGNKTFTGPPLQTVLKEAGIEHHAVTLMALNLYSVDFEPDEEFITDEYPIVTTRIDGEPYPVVDNGPLWILYPFDSGEFETSQKLFSHSIWQLTEITERDEE